MAATGFADRALTVVSTALDPVFYRTIYRDLPEGVSPLDHYLREGWREGRDPAPWFSVERYLKANPDLQARGVEPFSHYLETGRREGWEVAPSRHAEAYARLLGPSLPPAWSWEALTGQGDFVDAVGEADRRIAAEGFDEAFYLAMNPDVRSDGGDPLNHFLAFGWREGRNPAPWFSVRDYLECYPDIAASELNPFVHYLRTGQAEGRIPRLDLGFRYEIIAALKAPAETLNDSLAASASIAPDSIKVLERGLAAAEGLERLHVTFSHDDYTATFGGVQQCIAREGACFRSVGVDHLHIHPAHAWRLVREAGEPGPLGVSLNGRPLGTFTAAEIMAAFARRARPSDQRSFAIHSLLGHAADETADILQALGLRRGWFWLHDFTSLCAGFHLLRNGVEDCAAPAPHSSACGVCVHGPLRARHLDAHARLFERLELTVVAPSETTLDFWQASWRFAAAATVVLPHAALRPRGPRSPGAADAPFRLAFLGMPAPLKGWPIFKALAERFADDPRYDFVHLGGAPDPGAAIAFRPVVVDEAHPLAMRDALEEVDADAALIWSLCRETFSFTAYEAAAAGAAVITGPDSGNVAAFVASSGLGQVLSDEDALLAAFASGEIRRFAGDRRPMRHDLEYSGMTAELAAGAGG